LEAIELMSSKRNRCRLCGKSFSTDIALRRHLKEKHRGYYYGIRLAPLLILLLIIGIVFYVLATPGFQAIPMTGRTLSTSVTQAPTRTIQTSVGLSTTSASIPAPDFELPEVDELGLTGRSIRLSQFSGKPVFLEFISPLCGYCRAMTPTIKKLEEKYGDRIVFISVMGLGPSGIEVASEFLKEYRLSWIHVVDERLEVFRLYGVTGTPTYVILDSDHFERHVIRGATSEDVLEKAILDVIG